MTIITFGFAIGMTTGLLLAVSFLFQNEPKVDDFIVIGLLVMVLVTGMIIGYMADHMEAKYILSKSFYEYLNK
jgi:hypothetical protein